MFRDEVVSFLKENRITDLNLTPDRFNDLADSGLSQVTGIGLDDNICQYQNMWF